MSKHAIIGANIMDRLVKCPGSLKCATGSIAQYDSRKAKHKSKKDHYVKNRIECNEATSIGQKIDEMAKNLLRIKYGVREVKCYTTDEDYLDKELLAKAQDYCDHMVRLKNRLGKAVIDPYYDMSRFMKKIENVEFRVQFNPDYVATSNDGKLAYISELYSGHSYDRNKMFQVLCCAVGYVHYHKECENVICEVYNVSSKEVMLKKFSREELDAWKNDVILPALENVRAALSSPREEIEEHRHHCSWCKMFCIYRDEGCCACHDNNAFVENKVDLDLDFFYDTSTKEYLEEYNNLFK